MKKISLNTFAAAFMVCAAILSCQKSDVYDPAEHGGNGNSGQKQEEKQEEKQDQTDGRTESTAFTHVDGFSDFDCCGFTYRIRTEVLETSAAKKAMDKMEADLKIINDLIPEKQLKVMKSHPIWLEKDIQDNGAAWYHISKDWLASQGYMTEKAKCVEINNYVNYVSWSNQNQPYMVLHELCHLYHDQGLGLDYADIKNAYNNAVNSGMYLKTPYTDGKTTWNIDKAYCLTDCNEYFSEMCEAYWGENDYYPFNYNELKEYDPTAFALMEKVWGERTFE